MMVEEHIDEKIELLNEMKSNGYVDDLQEAIRISTDALKCGNKILLAGNGGSAADAQHFAGEIVGRFLMNRDAAPAISLCTDPSVLSCIANDFGYDQVFARQLSGLGRLGDVFIAISTSGNSENLIKAIQIAKEKGIKIIGLLGRDGGKIKQLCDVSIVVSSDSTPRIQEMHTFTVHMMCQQIEENLFEKK